MVEIKTLNVPPESSGIGPPPSNLSEAAAGTWNELVNLAPSRKWLANNRIWIEITTNLLVRDRESPEPEIRRLLLVMLSKALLDRGALEKLGINYDGEWPLSDDS